MSWFSKVLWSEGLFLKPQHFQQNDRYHERLLEARVRSITPYPWGFSHLEVDRDLAQHCRFGLRRAVGVMPDGTPFDLPADGPLPEPVEIPENATKQLVWLNLPLTTVNSREVAPHDGESAARWFSKPEIFIDSTAALRAEDEIDVAHPRFTLSVAQRPKAGHANLAIARILEVRDHTAVLDDKFVPPLLVCSAHMEIRGWIERVIGWTDTKLEELARYAADPTAGGGLQNAEYMVLQLLNRASPVFRHLWNSTHVHPERFYVELLRLVGELATFSTRDRRARDYPPYDHDNLERTFAPLLRDAQDFLSVRLGRRVIRLELDQRAPNAFVSAIRDRSLFAHATFVLEVSASRPLGDIQLQFPRLFKVGPNTKMNEIVHTHLPGVPLIHLPTPPSQLRAITDHVYFYLDKTSPLWPEFSVASSIGMHFSDDWPGLVLEFWAILEER